MLRRSVYYHVKHQFKQVSVSLECLTPVIILDTAKRELQEETSAIKFDIEPLCVYSVTGKTNVNENGEESFGLLCFAEILEFSGELESEIEKVEFMDGLPKNWTYPLIMPKLIEEYERCKHE